MKRKKTDELISTVFSRSMTFVKNHLYPIHPAFLNCYRLSRSAHSLDLSIECHVIDCPKKHDRYQNHSMDIPTYSYTPYAPYLTLVLPGNAWVMSIHTYSLLLNRVHLDRFQIFKEKVGINSFSCLIAI